MKRRKMSLIEEIFNSVTHGTGFLLSIAGLVLCVVFSVKVKNFYAIVSSSIYGASLILLYISSTLYHSFPEGKVKKIFKFFDHTSIYILIAGTYTPFALLPLRGPLGWSIFGVIWGLALLGIIFKIFFINRTDLISTIIYIMMGWMIIIAIKQVFLSIPKLSFIFLVIGGISYTLGTIFYILDRLFFFHIVWHIFVLIGSITHFFSIFLYIKSLS
ncbi:MAG: hemolysin III family protein [bacterium]|uniref:Channel protein n=1 Tax=candidate division TA06 bacterium 34_109 TaxID=1635277 RepID=A0A101I4F5_UNCT6|nr:MAG: Channel protein [candidate division TA06 bacterium 32_111]KUK88229.1 MAG: Channel protein [candidate division TA06 bacterium 34_109]MDI6701031.1 hemolysin III family protein [bacterium]